MSKNKCACLNLACTGCNLFRGIAEEHKVYCAARKEGLAFTEKDEVPVGKICSDFIAITTAIEFRPGTKSSLRHEQIAA